jgi:hypothetical protein
VKGTKTQTSKKEGKESGERECKGKKNDEEIQM